MDLPAGHSNDAERDFAKEIAFAAGAKSYTMGDLEEMMEANSVFDIVLDEEFLQEINSLSDYISMLPDIHPSNYLKVTSKSELIRSLEALSRQLSALSRLITKTLV